MNNIVYVDDTYGGKLGGVLHGHVDGWEDAGAAKGEGVEASSDWDARETEEGDGVREADVAVHSCSQEDGQQ